MTRFLPSQVPAQITAASRLRKTTCFNIRKNSCKISLTRTCKSDIIGNSLSGHGGIGRRVRFRFLWSQGCAGSSPVVRTKANKNEPNNSVRFFISWFATGLVTMQGIVCTLRVTCTLCSWRNALQVNLLAYAITLAPLSTSPVVRTKKRQSERVVFFHATADLKQNYVLSANDTAFVCPCTQQTWLTKECID